MNIVCSCLYKVHFTKEKLATHRNALGSVSLKLLEKPGTDLAACTSSAHSDRGWDCFGVCFAAEMPALSPEAVCWEQVPSASGLSSRAAAGRGARPAPPPPHLGLRGELLRVGAGLRVPSLVLLWIGNTVPRRGEPASEAAVLPGARARGEVRVRGGLRL